MLPLRWLRDVLRRLRRQHPVVRRARSMLGYKVLGQHPIRYQLGAGGRNPDAPHPAVYRDGRWACDCSGLAAWCLGIDRYQPEFPRFGGWINTDSMLASARAGEGWFEFVDRPRPGDLVVYGAGAAVGHVGVVVKVPVGWQRRDWRRLRVVHCSAGLDRRRGHAIGETGARPWASRNARFVRYSRRSTSQ